MNYKAQVIADASGKWVNNQLVFASATEALAYGKDLSNRWMAVREMRVVETDAPVNAAWGNDGLQDAKP